MAIEPISQDEFIRIMKEEGVPLPLAAAFYGKESSFGKNKRAFIHPSELAILEGKGRSADKFGYGSMQITRPTFESVMPEKNYADATDADLTRAAARYLKKAVNPDGSYDLQKAKNLYFGAGKDAAFGLDDAGNVLLAGNPKITRPYYPARDSKVAKEISRYEENVRKNFKEGSDLASIAMADSGNTQKTEAPSEGISRFDQLASQIDALLGQIKGIDPEALQKKYDTTYQSNLQTLQAASNRELAGQQAILDAFKMNPYGAQAEIQKTADALLGAQNRLRQTVADINFTSDYGPGIEGMFKSFVANLGGKLLYKQRVDEVNALSKASQDINQVVQGMQSNANKGVLGVKDIIQMQQESRLQATQAIASDVKAAQLELSGLRTGITAINTGRQVEKAAQDVARDREKLEQGWKRLAQGDEELDIKWEDMVSKMEAREAATEIAKRRQWLAEEKKKAQDIKDEFERNATLRRLEQTDKRIEITANRVGAKSTFGTDDLQKINDALTQAVRLENPSADPVKFESIQAVNFAFKGKLSPENQKLKDQAVKFLLTGEALNSAPLETAAELQVTRAPDMVTARAYGKIAQLAEQEKKNVLRLKARAMGKNTWEDYAKSARITNPKAVEAAEEEANKIVRSRFALMPVQEGNFEGNPINIMPFSKYLEAAEGGKLVTILKSANIDPKKLNNDSELFGRLAYAIMDKTVAAPQEEIYTAIQEYYKGLANARATSSIVKSLGLGVNPSRYVVENAKKEKFDLTSLPGIQTYMESAKKGVAAVNNRALGAGFLGNLQ